MNQLLRRAILTGLLVLGMVFTMAACGGTEETPAPVEDSDTETQAESVIVIENAWVRPAAAGSMSMDAEATDEPMDMEDGEMSGMGGGASMTGAFMVIRNDGDADDTLIAASTDVSDRVEIHETTVDENDVARMQEVGQITIPASDSVELRPGSYHIMLMELKDDLVAGDTLTLNLVFESGKEITVEAVIQEEAPTE